MKKITIGALAGAFSFLQMATCAMPWQKAGAAWAQNSSTPLHGLASDSTPESAPVQRTILRGGLFKAGTLNNLETINSERLRSTVRFMNGLNHQHQAENLTFHNPLSVTIDKSEFMGEPLIARLSETRCKEESTAFEPAASAKLSSSSYDYYLIVFHFNVPAVKYSVVPTSYGFARFTFDLQVFSPNAAASAHKKFGPEKIAKMYTEAGNRFKDKDVQGAVQASAIWPVRVVSIYPVNEVLTVNRDDTNEFEAQFKPEFQGGAAGSLTYRKTLKDTFAFDLPKVVGTGSSAGSVSWTFYPAKAQPLMLGSKTTMAIVGVPAGLNYKNLGLRVLSRFDYQITKAKIPLLWGSSVYDAKQVSLIDVPSLKEVTSLHSIDLPKEIRQTVADVFKADVKDKPAVSLVKGKEHDYLIDRDTGAVYLPGGGSWNAIQLTPPADESIKLQSSN